MHPAIETRGLRRVYPSGDGRVVALAGLDLRVEPGARLAIMGQSGSGKSTLLNLLGLLDRPDAGAYRLNGRDVSTLTSDAAARVRREEVGFVFQIFHLIPTATALRNVELPLAYAGVPARERRERAEAALESLGMRDRMAHTPRKLSGGQQQRVAIARAIVNDPSVILADEPTGALDSRTTAEILDVLIGLNEAGRTLIVVTHEDDVAARMGRTLRLADGEAVA